MTETDILRQIVQKQDELIKIHVDYVIAHEMEGYDWNLNFKEPANKVIDELADLKKQLEECKDGECKNCKYENIDGDMRPCKDCFTGFYTNWEPINE